MIQILVPLKTVVPYLASYRYLKKTCDFIILPPSRTSNTLIRNIITISSYLALYKRLYLIHRRAQT